ncbi:hypothetical protein FDZ71_04975, partial [bacterium]
MARNARLAALLLSLLGSLFCLPAARAEPFMVEVYAGKALFAHAKGDATYGDTTIDFSTDLESPATLGVRFDGVFPDTHRGLYVDVFILPFESSRVSDVIGAFSLGGSL